MATIIKTIGAGGDYSTVADWNTDLSNTSVYSSGDDAVGQMFNEVFTGSFTIDDGSAAELNSITLEAASGHGHDGTIGTGARFVMNTSAVSYIINIPATTIPIVIRDIEFNGGGYDIQRGIFTATSTESLDVNRCIFTNFVSTSICAALLISTSGVRTRTVTNNIIYNLSTNHIGAQDCYGIFCVSGASPTINIYNNTIYNLTNDNGSGDCFGIYAPSIDEVVSNNICMGISGTTSGSVAAFSINSGSYNMSDDSSATGTGSLINKVASDQFVSVGSDFHLKAGADAIGAGTDLGTIGNIDIDGRDRDAEGDTWDIGADQYVIVLTSVTTDNTIVFSGLLNAYKDGQFNTSSKIDINKDKVVNYDNLSNLNINSQFNTEKTLQLSLDKVFDYDYSSVFYTDRNIDYSNKLDTEYNFTTNIENKQSLSFDGIINTSWLQNLIKDNIFNKEQLLFLPKDENLNTSWGGQLLVFQDSVFNTESLSNLNINVVINYEYRLNLVKELISNISYNQSLRKDNLFSRSFTTRINSNSPINTSWFGQTLVELDSILNIEHRLQLEIDKVLTSNNKESLVLDRILNNEHLLGLYKDKIINTENNSSIFKNSDMDTEWRGAILVQKDSIIDIETLLDFDIDSVLNFDNKLQLVKNYELLFEHLINTTNDFEFAISAIGGLSKDNIILSSWDGDRTIYPTLTWVLDSRNRIYTLNNNNIIPVVWDGDTTVYPTRVWTLDLTSRK